MEPAEQKSMRRESRFQIAVLGSKSTITGMRLAGIKNAFAAEENQNALLRQFESIVSREDMGILIIDDSCSQIGKEIIMFIEANKSPIIVEIPGSSGKPALGIINTITKRASGAN